jgi:hypothetical protein
MDPKIVQPLVNIPLVIMSNLLVSRQPIHRIFMRFSPKKRWLTFLSSYPIFLTGNTTNSLCRSLVMMVFNVFGAIWVYCGNGSTSGSASSSFGHSFTRGNRPRQTQENGTQRHKLQC